MRRVALIGAGGQLGSDLVGRFESSYELFPLRHADLELCDHERVQAVLRLIHPDVVINTGAFHKVESCELDVNRAFAVNCHAVRNLAIVCNDLNAQLVHISTDYVFGNGRREPYPEDAEVSPLNVYGVSKAAGEYFVRGLSRDYLLIRTSGLYGLRGSSGKGGNFVETMLRTGREKGSVSVVTDQVFSPTFSADLAQMLERLVDARARGLFHITNAGSCSWFEFARAIFDIAGTSVQVTGTTSAAFGSPVRRPTYSVLDNRRLRERGFGALRPWRDALQGYIEARPTPVMSVA